MPPDNEDPTGAGCTLEKQKLRKRRKRQTGQGDISKISHPPKKFNTPDT